MVSQTQAPDFDQMHYELAYLDDPDTESIAVDVPSSVAECLNVLAEAAGWQKAKLLRWIIADYLQEVESRINEA